MKGLLSYVIAAMICFSSCATLTIDPFTAINDQLLIEQTIEQVDIRIDKITKAFNDKMVNMEIVQFFPKAFLIDASSHLSPYCNIDCAIDTLETNLSYFSDTYGGQGLVWMIIPYYDIENSVIHAEFFIELGITQDI